MTTFKKAIICIAFLILVAWIYTRIGYATLERSKGLSLLTPLDVALPFIPEMVFFYVSIHLFWVVPVFTRSVTVSDFFRFIALAGETFFWCFVIHCLMPSLYPRPTLHDDPSSAIALLRFYYSLDFSNNTFPSTHCAAVTILSLMMQSKLRSIPYFFYEVWGALILTSTVLVKQHYLVDVCGGIVIATLIFQLSRRSQSSVGNTP